MTAPVGIAVAFAKAVDQNAGILVAIVHNAGHGDNVPFNVELCLQVCCIVPEGNQDILKLVHRGGHFQTKVVQPCGVDKAHIAHGLDGSLLITQLLNPGKRPDMAIFIGAHGPILGSQLKHLGQIGHIFVDVFFQVDNNALLCILQQIRITEAGIEHKVRQCIDVGHFQYDFFAPLIRLNGLPFHMNIGLLFQALENGTIIGLRFRTGGEIGQAGNGSGFCQRKGKCCRVHFQSCRITCSASCTVAACQQTDQHGEDQRQREHLCQLFHMMYSPFHYIGRSPSVKHTK